MGSPATWFFGMEALETKFPREPHECLLQNAIEKLVAGRAFSTNSPLYWRPHCHGPDNTQRVSRFTMTGDVVGQELSKAANAGVFNHWFGGM